MLEFLDPLATMPALFIGACTVLGLLIGSFLNVVIYRVPVMMDQELRFECASLADPGAEPPAAFNLVTPRSRCPSCKAPITALQNVPVLSWLVLGRKCANCKTPISARYPAVELVTGVLSGFIAWHFGFGAMTFAALVFTWLLIALTMIDFDTQFLPDQLTYPLLWLGLLVSLTHPVWAEGAAPITPRDSIIGAAAGYLSLWGVYWTFKLLTGKEGMGYGDFKLFAALGAWLGWQMLLPIILFASVVGALFGIGILIRQRRGKDTPIAFGPFLAIAGWLAMIFGHTVVVNYLALFTRVDQKRPMRSKFRVGLTGGIASGKTTVANLFAALAVPIIDTDLLAREVVAPGTALLVEVAAHFGHDILAADGSLDRGALRERVFKDPAERRWLEERLHPAIRVLTDLRSGAAKGPYCMVAIPLLVETGARDRFERVLVVDCEPEIQLARLVARDGVSREAAERMLAAQAPRAERLAVADDVVRNDGDLASLRQQVEKLHRQYLAAAAAHSGIQSARDAT